MLVSSSEPADGDPIVEKALSILDQLS